MLLLLGAPRGVVSRHSSLCYCFWVLLVVLLFLGIHHYAIAFGCSSWCCCFEAFITMLLLLGAHHCAIVYGCVPHSDVALGHLSSCFSSWLHKVKLLLNISK
jgi:hypothetical protein